MQHQKTLYYDVPWSEIEETSKTLSEELKETHHFDTIVSITRGGLIPAGLIARYLDIFFIETLCISSYDKSDNQKAVKLVKGIAEELNKASVLIIDDLVDTGETLRYIRKTHPKATYATLFAKPDGIAEVDHYVKEVAQNTWLVFPWEKL